MASYYIKFDIWMSFKRARKIWHWEAGFNFDISEEYIVVLVMKAMLYFFAMEKL